MRIYRGSDADIVLRPFMVKLSEIVSFDLQLWTSGTYVVNRNTSESGMTTDKENNIINVHLTDKETGYLEAGVLNAKLMYRITDSEYPDGIYDGIITIPQEYYMMTPPDYSGGTVGDIYESGYTEGYNTAIQNSVLSINGEKGDLNLKTINGNGLLGEGDIKIEGGGSTSSDNVIVLDGLTQEERKTVYDKLDKTKTPDEVFVYEGNTSVRAYWGGSNYLKFITFSDSYDGLKVIMYSLDTDGNLGYEDRGMTYTNSVLMHLGSHVDESGYFECFYIGNFFEYILRPYTRPNACFINLEKGIGDSTRPIYAPVSTLVEKYGDRNNVRMQFIANEKLYTFLLDPNQDNKWLFESAKPITEGGSSGGDIPTKVSQLKNDSKYINQSSQSSIYNIEHIWAGNQSQYDALETKDARTLFIII